MSELDVMEMIKMFDIFLVLLENPTLSKDMNVKDVTKAFHCAHLIETTIAKACEIDKEKVLENHLHGHWLKENRTNLYKCSELAKACDKLLELYLKSSSVSTDIVDEFLKLYTQYCGSNRLNAFITHVVLNGMCMNVIIGFLEKLGISAFNMQDEALIISWEILIDNGNQYEVAESINKMFNDGFHSKLVQFAVNLNDNSKIKQLVIQLLTDELVKNDENICLDFLNIERKSLWKIMQNNSELYMNFLDAIFYFARHMKLVHTHWKSNCKFEYEHLLKVVRVLLNGPIGISKIIYNRLELVKTHPNGTIWHKISKDINQMTQCAR